MSIDVSAVARSPSSRMSDWPFRCWALTNGTAPSAPLCWRTHSTYSLAGPSKMP
ncbi:MAG TPA: hypothetical protein VHB02_13220 [Acidimicrobiales bacterium]|nr:hypothetical protein [Acidimicrobiales bacterium]